MNHLSKQEIVNFLEKYQDLSEIQKYTEPNKIEKLKNFYSKFEKQYQELLTTKKDLSTVTKGLRGLFSKVQEDYRKHDIEFIEKVYNYFVKIFDYLNISEIPKTKKELIAKLN